MKTSLTPIIPVDQSVVTIAGHEIPVVCLPDGDVGAPLRAFCEMLALHYSTQVQKVQRHPAIYDKLVLVLLKTSGGPQEVNVIIAEAIPIWLTSMHVSRVASESRELLRICQRDAARTIRSRFFPDAQARPQPKSSAQPKPGPESTLPPPLSGPEVVPLSIADLLRELLRHVEQKERNQEALIAHLDQEYHNLLAQLAEMQRRLRLNEEQVAALWAVVTASSRAGAPSDLLTADHQRTLGVLLDLVCRQTGQPLEALKRELLAAMGAERMEQLREGQWDNILGWVRQVMNWGMGTFPQPRDAARNPL